MIQKDLEVGPLDVNCYIVGCKTTKDVVIIDPGGDVKNILQVLNDDLMRPVYIIATHAHFDHISGVKGLQDATGCQFLLNKNDLPLVENIAKQAEFFGIKAPERPIIDRFIKEGDKIKVGNLHLKVIDTPGHTPGGISLYIDNKAFVGDTIFHGSIGRTDLPGGSYETLISSIKDKIFTLDDNTKLYPGHGPSTTIKYEKRYNPFLNTLIL